MKVQEAVIKRMGGLTKEQGMTMNALANTSGVARSTVKSICNGSSRNTGIVTIKKLCDGLDITVADFFSSEEFEDLDQEIG